MTFGNCVGVKGLGKSKDGGCSGIAEGADDERGKSVELDTRDLIVILESLPINAIFPTLKHWFIRHFTSYPLHARRFNQYFTAKIAESRQRLSSLGADDAEEVVDNALDMVVVKQMRGGESLEDEELKQELMQYVAAGSETTDITISWFVKYMSNNPKVQHNLRKHLLETIPELEDRSPTYSDLCTEKTPYLEAVVHEVLRLGHIAAGTTRDAVEDVVILGRVIPKGTTILMPYITALEDESTPVTQIPKHLPHTAQAPAATDVQSRSVEIADSLDDIRSDGPDRKVGFWKAGTGETFDPTRWLDDGGKFDIHAGPSMPFSMGPRGCFGHRLAMMSLRMYFAMITLAFFLDKVDDEFNTYDTIETHTAHPAQVHVKPVAWESIIEKLKQQ